MERSVTDVINGYCWRITLLTNLRTVIHFSPIAVLEFCTDITWWIHLWSMLQTSLFTSWDYTIYLPHTLNDMWLVHIPDISVVLGTYSANVPDSLSTGRSVILSTRETSAYLELKAVPSGQSITMDFPQGAQNYYWTRKSSCVNGRGTPPAA